MARQVQLRRDLAATWVSVNPVLAQGELGTESDTTKAKMGNGVDHWNDLPYWSTGADGVEDAEAAAAAAAASAAASAASAVAAAASASSARSHATTASSNAANAIAAASVSGDVSFFGTYAEAAAALATLAEGAIVEVMIDETRNGGRTRYRVESGVLVFKLLLSDPSLTTVHVQSALGYKPAYQDGQYLVISAPYHHVRACDLHLTHLAATTGLKVLNVQHLARGSLLKVRTDSNPQIEMAIDATSAGFYYGSNARNGHGVAANEFRALKLRPNCNASIRVRTRRELHVEYQSRYETTIVIPTNPTGVTSHSFEHRDGFYAYEAYITIPVSGTRVLTLPTMDSFPASGNFRGIDAVRRWDTTLAARNISVQVLQNGTFGAGFIPPHPGALTTSGNDTTLTIYNNSTALLAAVVRVGKLLPVLTQV